tara:strand:- start:645 stop:1262 length:618 start_codon:yes stop_codon:yes gene_type:complete
MKINEALIIGGALLATLVLSKGRAASSVLQNFTIPLLSNENQIKEEITTVIVKPPQFTRIDVTDQLRNISSLQLEKNITPLQNQINEAQKYILTQQKFQPSKQFESIAPDNIPARNLIGKFEGALKYYSKVWSGEKGSISGQSVFPDFRLLLTQSNRNILQTQAQFEIAQENIGKANEIITRQQAGIDLINEEYQTRFGGLSRYG